jgi:hypothetical protein
MAHCRPTRITTHGEGKHLSQALGAFIVELTKDRRVLDYYDSTWRPRRRRAEEAFEEVIACHPAGIPTTLVDWCIADRDARDQAATAAFLAGIMPLPLHWLPVVTAQLREAFFTVYQHRRTDPDQRPAVPLWGVAVQLQPGHARGKVPQTPDVVQRPINWLYRHKFAERRETRGALARELQARTGRGERGEQADDDCRRDVWRGIAQAEGWMDLAAASTWRDGRIIVSDG